MGIEESANYLGNTITSEINGLLDDTKIKRARYIEKNSEILQEFFFAHPKVKCNINRIYNSSFPGSVLWDLSSRNTDMLLNSWSVSVRYMWDLPLKTHRHFIEALGGMHAKTMLYTRFTKFIQQVRNNKKEAFVYLL